MIITLALVALVLLNPITLMVLLRPALACVDGGSRKPHHVLAALLALVVDLVGCNTWWRLLGGRRQGSEKTISDTLERLCLTPGPQQYRFVVIAAWINEVSPTGRHIQAVALPRSETSPQSGLR